jgi:glycosyltransferase involved in cell wall biosynthesis
MIILTTTYNCAQYIERCLLSIMSQRFKNFTCYITDDLSTDDTKEIVKKTIQGDSRFILVENTTKMYQPGNYNQIINGKSIPDEEICVEVDGDDWLPNSIVFDIINDIYKDNKVWMTSGSFKYHDGRQGFAKPPSSFTNIRKQTFTLSHLRTWKSWLWKKIKEEDLKDENGNYWSVAGDLSFMFPMLEMSGEEHYRFLPNINYIYNESNPINDHKVNLNNVFVAVNKIRNKTPYEKL